MRAGFLPVSIAKEKRLEYFKALESYAVDDNLNPFPEMIALLEGQRLDEYLSIAQQERPEGLGMIMTMLVENIIYSSLKKIKVQSLRILEILPA